MFGIELNLDLNVQDAGKLEQLLQKLEGLNDN
jgi:hypothetical protein